MKAWMPHQLLILHSIQSTLDGRSSTQGALTVNIADQKTVVKTKRVGDPELQAMSEIGKILSELDTVQIERVVEWFAKKHLKPSRPFAIPAE
jgi:hypothetical protein